MKYFNKFIVVPLVFILSIPLWTLSILYYIYWYTVFMILSPFRALNGDGIIKMPKVYYRLGKVFVELIEIPYEDEY